MRLQTPIEAYKLQQPKPGQGELSLALLRVLFIVETLIALLASKVGFEYIDWKHAPAELMNQSPDAWYLEELTLSRWEFLSGCSFGILLTVIILAATQRKEIVQGSAALRLHWIALALPPIAVLIVADQLPR